MAIRGDSPERAAERGRGPEGPGGPRGSGFVYGASAPGTSVGVVNDFYLDTAKFRIYGPKLESGWPVGFAQLLVSVGLDTLIADMEALLVQGAADTAEAIAALLAQKGAADGIAPLDAEAKLPAIHLPDGVSAAAIAANVPKNTDGSDFTQPATVLSALGGASLTALAADGGPLVGLAAIVSGAPIQTVADAFSERVTIGRLVSGFDPDEGDNTTVLQTAVTRALAHGVALVIPASISEVSAAVVIGGALPIIGPRGSKATFRRMVAATAVFTAEDLADGPSYQDLAFINDPLAPAYVSDPSGVGETYGRFVQHTRVHGVHAERVSFDGRNGSGVAGIFSAFQNMYGDDQTIVGLKAVGILGNVAGPNGDGAGAGGKRHRYSQISIVGGGDTGIGAWTGAEDFVLDQFYIAPVSNAADANLAPYTKVGVDCAGATGVVLGSGKISGGTVGVRIASNDVGATVYHNDDIVLTDGLRLSLQEASTAGVPEPAQGVKISHAGPGLCRFRSRARYTVGGSGQYGILGHSTHATGTLDIDIDKSRFEGVGSAYVFQGSLGAGILRFRPGTAQTKDMNTAGGAVTSGNGTNAGSSTVDDPRQNVVYDRGDSIRDLVTFNNTSTLNKLCVENLTVGYYRVQIVTGAMSDVSGGVTLQILDGGFTVGISAAHASSTLEFYVNLTIDYSVYEISYTSTADGNNYAFKRVLIQKLT